MHRPALLVAFVAIFLIALALTGREHTVATILPAVGVCQVVLHVLLSWLSPMPAMEPLLHVATGGQVSAMDGHGGFPGLSMLLMHAVAGLVTAWWLECGEAGLCGLVRRLAGWVLRPLLWPAPEPVRTLTWSTPVWRRPPSPHSRVLRHIMVRRGPPARLPLSKKCLTA
ncbi:hypothetical protein [Actinomadura alba]|uniref:MFS transporter n=1 Tax=Actinomadura alba TaxID=406431 RepID=A0ABR7LNY0_9ACTN|nr:hypothetical protein [Actinomadura alba]MBC6466466.1 hypothetical protein [Actinomadura alba]